MSNPLLNRWGSNIYWLKYWYTDINYSANLQHDRFTEQLLFTYLFFGATTYRNLFYHRYWYQNLNAKFLPRITYLRQFYYRPFTRFNLVDEDYTLSTIRHQSSDFYRMRVWILKFSNWFVVNSYWFQPLKKKRIKRRRSRLLFFVEKRQLKFRYLLRLKILQTTLSLDLGTNTQSYNF